jgi:hypothetical protein
MAGYNQGAFEPKNPQKYIGTFPITYRSAWELTFMNVCDNHPNITQWASESIQIPYMDPFDPTKKRTYIPDFFIIYVDKNGAQHAEIIEIKPLSQSIPEAARTRKDQEAIILNEAKWKAAYAWCKAQNITFRIMTEQQLYRTAGGK